MTRAQMTALFLATLDELAHSDYCGGSPNNPTLDIDVVFNLLEEVHSWSSVPYPVIRRMFAVLLAGLSVDDSERMYARVSLEFEFLEEARSERAEADREERARSMATKALALALADGPRTLQLFVGDCAVIGNRLLQNEAEAQSAEVH